MIASSGDITAMLGSSGTLGFRNSTGHLVLIQVSTRRMPKWAAGFLKGDNTEVSVKTPMAGLLLKLEWEGSPVLYDRKNGYRWT